MGPTMKEFLDVVRTAYRETRKAVPSEGAIVFCCNNSTRMGREVSLEMPGVVLGIDPVRIGEIAVAGLPLQAAISLLHSLEKRHGAPLTNLPPVPPGHFWAISFGAGRQMTPISVK